MKTLILFFMLFCVTKSNGQQWKPNPKYIKSGKQDSTAASRKAYQCYGTTAKGERCKRKVNTDHSFCYQHINQQ